MISNNEINDLAVKFIELKKKSLTKEPSLVKEFNNFQNHCMKVMAPLVLMKARKYKKFSNYNDLVQDGFEALLLAFETYNINKGDFSYWASQYIKTRIYRSANAHSTIRFPIKKAKQVQPYKTSTIPVLIDNSANQCVKIQKIEDEILINKILDELPDLQKQVISMYYDFSGNKNGSISHICDELGLSRTVCLKIIEEAQVVLKEKYLKLI
jgi:RNA polymerase sigma factor (sigma-70 family)